MAEVRVRGEYSRDLDRSDRGFVQRSFASDVSHGMLIEAKVSRIVSSQYSPKRSWMRDSRAMAIL
jgi:hypothetical protein